MASRVPLVLIPGLVCTAELWVAQIEGLADVAACLVADHRRSETIAGIARDVLAEAPERFALAGLSMGGYVAFEIMRRAPDRVLRLALLSTSARADTAAARRDREDLIRLTEQGRFHGVGDRLLPIFIHHDRLDDAELTATIRRMAAETGADGFVRQQRAIMSRPDSRADLAAIRCPTLVLCGRQDALTPLAVNEEIAAGIPGATLRVIEDCGHLPTLERPDETTAALHAWLTGD